VSFSVAGKSENPRGQCVGLRLSGLRACLGDHGQQVLVNLQEVGDRLQRCTEFSEVGRDGRLGLILEVVILLSGPLDAEQPARYSSRRSPAARSDLGLDHAREQAAAFQPLIVGVAFQAEL
jgi:hypothetical protein